MSENREGSKSWIILLDTSILLNVLDVPGRNQDREIVFDQLEEEVKAGSNLLLPFATVIEVGSHISRLPNGNQRLTFARKFVRQMDDAFAGNTPWSPMKMPDKQELAGWLSDFPENAVRKISLADHTIIKEWEFLCALHPNRNIRIWSLDNHLSGFQQ